MAPFRTALEATGRRIVIIAAVTTSTCLLFPSLDMLADGYEVHGVIDASGSEAPGQIVREAVVADLTGAGARPRTWFFLAAELVADWRRDEAAGWPLAGTPVHDHLPSWGYLPYTDSAYVRGDMQSPDLFVPGSSQPTRTIPARRNGAGANGDGHGPEADVMAGRSAEPRSTDTVRHELG